MDLISVGEANVFLRNHESVVGRGYQAPGARQERRSTSFAGACCESGEPLISALARVSALSGEVDVWRALGERTEDRRVRLLAVERAADAEVRLHRASRRVDEIATADPAAVIACLGLLECRLSRPASEGTSVDSQCW
jgi:hypothetical protein